jgi:hypothetical protein
VSAYTESPCAPPAHVAEIREHAAGAVQRARAGALAGVCWARCAHPRGTRPLRARANGAPTGLHGVGVRRAACGGAGGARARGRGRLVGAQERERRVACALERACPERAWGRECSSASVPFRRVVPLPLSDICAARPCGRRVQSTPLALEAAEFLADEDTRLFWAYADAWRGAQLRRARNTRQRRPLLGLARRTAASGACFLLGSCGSDRRASTQLLRRCV